MSEPIISVERLTQVASRLHRHPDDSPRYRFHPGAERETAGDRRRLRLGQEHLAVAHRRARHADHAARCSSPAPTCSRSTRTRARRCARAKVGFVFQSFQLLGNLNALENVMLPLELAGRARCARARRPRCCAASASASGWATIRGCFPAASSSASRWRAPSSSRPPLLLADEPTGSLDFATGETVMAADVRAEPRGRARRSCSSRTTARSPRAATASCGSRPAASASRQRRQRSGAWPRGVSS